MFKFFRNLVIFIALIIVGIFATGHGYIFTAIERVYLAGHTTANINDYPQFKTRTIATANPQPLARSEQYNRKSLPNDLIEQIKAKDAIAFMVVKDGQLIHEEYFKGYDNRSKTNSFSMAKTVTTLLLGIAIEEGYIESLEQAATDFLPEFRDDPLGSKATIGQFSLMTSGYEWTEHYYTPFSPTVQLLYGDDITDFLTKRHFSAEPSTFWEYSSASTQLMGIFIQRALETGGYTGTISDYLSEKIWQPMQMNDDALWHTDDEGMELVFCCINTNAENYAKLGLLMLNRGVWNDQQLVPASFIDEMIKPVGQVYYGLSTWLGMHKQPAHYQFSGHLGQFIIVVPEQDMVIVRLGEQSPFPNEMDFLDLATPKYIKAANSLIE